MKPEINNAVILELDTRNEMKPEINNAVIIPIVKQIFDARAKEGP